MLFRTTLSSALLSVSTLSLATDYFDIPPASHCVKPEIPAIGTDFNVEAANILNTKINKYRVCSKTYVDARRKVASEHPTFAAVHLNSAEAYINDYNAFASALEIWNVSRPAVAAGQRKKAVNEANQSGRPVASPALDRLISRMQEGGR